MEIDGYVVVDHPKRGDLLDEAREWLSPTDYAGEGSEYAKHLAAVAPNTGQWLLHRNQDFQAWQTSDDRNVLWIKGAPGSGKSILAASIVRHLAADSIVAYGFLRRTLSTNNTFAFLVRDFIMQLLPRAPEADSTMRLFLESRDQDVEPVPVSELWQLLVSIIGHLPHVTLVVDALDEILPGQETRLLDNILDLAKSGGGKVKALITSRPLSNLEALFRGASVHLIQAAGSAIDEDVSRYISHRLQMQAHHSLSPVDCQLIQAALVKSLFLQARLTLDEILCGEKVISEALQKLPGSLTDLYRDVLYQYSSGSENIAKLQRLVLLWITHSYRPIRLLEIAHIAIFEGHFDNVATAKSAVRSCCGPLIEIRKDETVHVCHHSLSEFLLESHFFVAPGNGARLQTRSILESNHRKLGMSCLDYMLSGTLAKLKDATMYPTNNLFTQASKYPLLMYAAGHWHYHIKHTCASDTELFNKLDALLFGGSQEVQTWTRLSKLDMKVETAGMGRLHFAAHFGLTAYVEHLLAQGVDVNERDSKQRKTAIMYAVDGGHEETVQFLISHSANLDAVDAMGLAAVHLAVLGNQQGCLQRIAAAGANITALVSPSDVYGAEIIPRGGFRMQGKQYEAVEEDIYQLFRIRARHLRKASASSQRTLYGCSAVQLACEIGLDGILKVLISFLDEATRASIPLHWAAAGGHAVLLELLLQYPDIKESVNSKNYRGNTPLFIASRSGSPGAVQALLEHGAEPRIMSGDRRPDSDSNAKKRKDASHKGVSCLHSWVGMTALSADWAEVCRSQGLTASTVSDEAFLAIGETLLKAGADPNAVTDDGRTALFSWAALLTTRTRGSSETSSRQTIVVELLLRYGADPRIQDNKGLTALHLMKGTLEELPTIKLLVGAGADINAAQPSTGCTPLHTLFPRYNGLRHVITSRAMSEMATLGAEFNQKDNQGNSPLHWAVRALTVTSDNELVQTVMASLLKFCDPNIKNHAGETVLYTLRCNTFHRQFEPIVNLLVESGIDLEARDTEGKTALLEACRWRDESIMGLAKLGADVQACDNRGKTCLHYFFGTQASNSAFYNHRDCARIVQALEEHGAALDAVDDAGNTIFHGAATDSRNQHFTTGILPKALETLRNLSRTTEERIRMRHIASIKNRVGQNPLHSAAALIPSKAIVDDQEAAWFDFFLDPELDLDASLKDVKGETPLHLAAALSEARAWKLVEAGADVTVVSNRGRVPLHEAAKSGNSNCIALLCQESQHKRITVDIPDENGETPLHEAARSGKYESVKVLLDTGADINAVNHAGLTPAQIAAALPVPKLDDNHFLNIAAHVINHAKDEAGAPWRYSKEEDPFKDPPLDVVLEELEKPDHQEVILLLAGVDLLSDTTTRDILLAGTELAYPVTGAAETPKMARGEQMHTTQERDGRLELTRELVAAVVARKRDQIPDLIIQGADARCPIFEGYESLAHIVVRSGDLKTLQAILPLIGDLNSFKPPLLHVAADRKQLNLAVMEYLLDLGADPNGEYEDKRQLRRTHSVRYSGKHNVMHLMSLGHHWWHSQGLLLVAGRGGDLSRTDGRGLACPALCADDADRHNNKGPYASLCTTAVFELKPPGEPEYCDGDLVRLIMDGDVEAVKDLLEGGADANGVYQHEDRKMIPLEACAAAWDESVLNSECGDEGMPDIIALLLQHGADPAKELPSSNGATRALHNMCAHNAPVRPFLDAGVDMEMRDLDGATPLIAAAGWAGYVPQGGRDFFAAELAAAGADANAVDNEGRTALHRAVQSDSHLSNPEVIDALLRAGADVALRDRLGHEAFYYFLRTDGADMEHYKNSTLQELFDRGAAAAEDVDEETGETNAHVLLRLIGEEPDREYFHPSELQTLVDIYRGMLARGADSEARDETGQTPVFHLVRALGHRRLPGDPGKEWYTALLEGHDLTTVNGAGDTLLHVLAREPKTTGWATRAVDEDATLFKLLIDLGIDPKQENQEGMSAVDLAAAHDHTPILRIFEDSQG